jgi:hypothetical protein
MKKSLPLSLGGLLVALLIQGCAPASYKVTAPTASEYVYAGASSAAPLQLSVKDARAENEKTFSYGLLKADLLLNNKSIEPIAYISEHTTKELQARGIDAQVTEGANVNLNINKLYIRNHRVSGYSPFVTFSLLSADINTPKGSERVGIFIKRGKVPVWSFDEVIEPTYNEPLSLLVKELAAKINTLTVNQAISNDQVTKLVTEINAKPAPANAYLKVYQLGFGNNKSAIKALVELSKNDDEYIRLAAISALGILKADGELEHLKGIYASSKLWQDRGMALKAICDIGTPEALAFAKQAKADLDKPGKDKDDVAWTNEILNLYF